MIGEILFINVGLIHNRNTVRSALQIIYLASIGILFILHLEMSIDQVPDIESTMCILYLWIK